MAFFVVAALVGLLVGWVVCGSLPPLQRGVLVIGVFFAWTVTMVALLSGGSAPPFPPVQFAIALLGASPVILVSGVASLLAKRFHASRSAALAGATAAAVASSPLCMFALFGAACWLAGECL